MRSYLFVREVIVVTFFLFLPLAACAPEIETVVPATRLRSEATGIPAATFTPTAVAPTTQPTTLAATVRPTEQVSVGEATAETAGVTPTPDGAAAVLGEPVVIGRGIRDAAFSPDGESVVAGWTNGVSLVRVDDQEELWFRQTPHMVTAVDTSGTAVAAVLVTGDVWLFEANSGDSQVFEGAAIRNSFWGDVAWSPEGRLAAIQTIGGAGAGATPILLLDPAAGEIRELPGSRTNSGWQPHLRWSPDGRMIAAADENGRGWVLDVNSGEVVFRLEEGEEGGRPRIHGWMPDSTVVVHDVPASSGLRLTDVATGEAALAVNDGFASDGVFPAMVLAEDSGLALVGGWRPGDYQIYPYEVWDLAGGRPLGVPQVGEQRHVNSAGCMLLSRTAVRFDGEEALYLDSDGKLVRWPVGAGEGEVVGWLPVRYPCLITPMVWSPDSTRLVLEMDPGRVVTVWDVASGQLIAEKRDGTYPADIHGSLLAYRSANGQLILWDLERQVVVAELPGPVTLFSGGVAFSADGNLLAYGAGNTLQIAEVATGEIITALDAYAEAEQISHIRWAPDGDALVASGGLSDGITEEPGTTILWERAGNSFREVFRTESIYANYDAVWANPALFSRGGELVALERLPELEAGRQVVIVYDRTSGEIVLERPGYVIQQWLSDEVLLVRESAGNMSLMEWHVRTGEERSTGRSGGQAEYGAYAPNGMYHADVLYSPPPPRSVAIREWRTGQQVATAYLGSDVQDLVFSPDGRWLAVRGTEGLVKVWPVSYAREG